MHSSPLLAMSSSSDEKIDILQIAQDKLARGVGVFNAAERDALMEENRRLKVTVTTLTSESDRLQSHMMNMFKAVGNAQATLGEAKNALKRSVDEISDEEAAKRRKREEPTTEQIKEG